MTKVQDADISDSDSLERDIWRNFTSDPTTGVTLVSVEGEILYINEQSIRIFFNESRDPKTLVGVSMYDLGFPAEWARERIELFKKIQETGDSVLLRTVWHAKQQFSWMSLISSDEDDEPDRILVITRRISATDEAKELLKGEYDVINSNLICLGELKSLTPRELEVLALIGQGMTIKEIASALFRSVKTIENHRESIGRKLKKTRGLELACIAHSAGLVIEDSLRQRVKDDSQ